MTKPKQHIDDTPQSLSLHQLMDDFSSLEEFVNDAPLKKQIQKVKNELKDFDKILRKKRSYTQEEIDTLANSIDHLAGQLQDHTKKLIQDRVAVAGIYAAFIAPQEVANIKAKLLSAEEHLRIVRAHSHGHERTPLEKLSRACHHARKSIVSFFKTALSIKEHGKNAPIFNKIREKMSWPQKAVEDETKPQVFKRKNKWM